MTIQKLDMNCPRCRSERVVKNGHCQGKQSYLCRGCKHQFRENPSPKGYSAEVKDICIKMSLNGMGFRGIERACGINHNSGIGWVRKAAALPDKENYQLPETAQVDELQTFIGQKKQNLALDSCEYETTRNC